MKLCLWLSCCSLIAGAMSPVYAADEPKRVGYPESLANVIYSVAPLYTPQALRLKTWSRVEIDAYVDTDGAVYSTVIVMGDQHLVTEAENTVKQWQFKPFVENGQPIPAIARIVFDKP
jgi:outer membrane biosynthesis protein TonB